MTTPLLMLFATAALRALLVGATVWLGLCLLRVRNVIAQKAAWTLVLFAAFLLPLVPATLPFAAHLPGIASLKPVDARVRHAAQPKPITASNALPAAPPTSVATQQTMAPGSRKQSASRVEKTASFATSERMAQATTTHPAEKKNAPKLSLFALSLGLYLAVASLLLARQIYGLARTLALWQAARPTQRIEGVAVRFSRAIASPVTLGSGVLLPDEATGWSQSQRRVVLAHERTHVQQCDFYLQLGAGLYAALVWPSPLGWLLKRKLYELGEALGDRAGAEAATSPSAYARLILEFAARPRPTIPGVAMANPRHLSQRIERLLDEARFHHAFAHSRRALLALLVVPAALLTATTLVRVEAATPQQSQATPATAQPADATAPAEQLPPPPPSDPQGPPPPPAGAQQGMMPPPPPQNGPGGPGGPQNFAQGPQGEPQNAPGPHGDPFTLVENGKAAAESRPDAPPAPEDLIAKARKQTKSDSFLIFEHAGKHYIVDDPAVIAKFKAAHKPMPEFSTQLRAQSEKFNADFQKQMEQMRKQINEIKVPDLTKEMEQANKALAELKAKQGTVIDRKQLADLQRELAGIEQQLMRLQFNGFAGPGGPQHGPMPGFNGNSAGPQHEPDQAVRSLLDESVKSGKAKPVE